MYISFLEFFLILNKVERYKPAIKLRSLSPLHINIDMKEGVELDEDIYVKWDNKGK
jgi:hypothetical protein